MSHPGVRPRRTPAPIPIWVWGRGAWVPGRTQAQVGSARPGDPMSWARASPCPSHPPSPPLPCPVPPVCPVGGSEAPIKAPAKGACTMGVCGGWDRGGSPTRRLCARRWHGAKGPPPHPEPCCPPAPGQAKCREGCAPGQRVGATMGPVWQPGGEGDPGRGEQGAGTQPRLTPSSAPRHGWGDG